MIEQLKKGTKGNEELQGKITAYEDQVAQLQTELEQTKIKYAVKTELLSQNVVDAVDKFEEEEITDKVMFVNPAQITALRKDPDFLSADKYQAGVAVSAKCSVLADYQLFQRCHITEQGCYFGLVGY